MNDIKIMGIFISICIFCFLLTISSVFSRVEKLFRKQSNAVVNIYIPWSLQLFKLMTSFIFIMISIECVFYSSLNIFSVVLGLIIILLGLTLRILAIQTLGSMWTFHVALLEEHKYIDTGIYRYVKHPAYLGNIYIIGLALIFGSLYSSIFASLWITSFMLIRIPIEDSLLSEIRHGDLC
jgi:isoprenylcysteine carboxyl methyltransferase (ICMT) family protein YpbQ